MHALSSPTALKASRCDADVKKRPNLSQTNVTDYIVTVAAGSPSSLLLPSVGSTE